MSTEANDRPHVQYPDELLQPIYVPNLLDLIGNRTTSGLKQFVNEKRLDKLDKLLAFYGIDAGQKHKWQILALKLAIEHIDGFRLTDEHPRRPEMPTAGEIRADQTKQRLFEAVKARIAASGGTIPNAIQHLIDSKGEWFGKHHRTLAQRYKEARSKNNKRGQLIGTFHFIKRSVRTIFMDRDFVRSEPSKRSLDQSSPPAISPQRENKE